LRTAEIFRGFRFGDKQQTWFGAAGACAGDAILDHAKLRGANWSAETVALDLGDEPPLSVDGDKSGVDRRRVSVQWFSGTILTGLCGAALMGGAVFAALDGETNFAAVPDRLETALRGSLVGIGDRLSAVARKSDRLPSGGEINSARNIIRQSTMVRVGDREVVRVKPYVRVSSNLALSVTDLSASIPAFNPQKMLIGDSSTTAAPDQDSAAAAAEPNVEVSFVTRDLAPVLTRARIAATVSLEDVVSRVREMASFTGSASSPYPVASSGVQLPGKYAYAAEGTIDPYAGFETRIVPENITMLPKTASQTGSATNSNEKIVVVKKNESISTILRDLGAKPEEIKAIAAVLGPRGKDNGLKEGLRLRILLSMQTGRAQPVRVIVANDNTVEAVVALSDVGRYVPVDAQSAESQITSASEDDEDDDGTGVRLYQSIYETALRNQVPRPVIDDLIRIYSYDVDFQRRTQPGDSFEVLYTGDDDNNPANGEKSDVVFAALNVGGEVKKFYKFVTADDGLVDYYDETGKSAKKFLVRKPVADGILRSGFGARHHPILGYTKMHTGVDWAAPMGTPIYAAGSGTIEKAAWESGYGKYIRIRHANGYETAYGHMTAFARGMEPGVKVRQGQLIGFVGSTGLSTGAHVHYEIIVNDRFVDPMRIKLPRGRALDGAILANFEKERDRLDAMMTKAPARIAGAMGSAGR
jgi:murein DD-endopeptidase MepM/ murein hydrolase activator NlpD